MNNRRWTIVSFFIIWYFIVLLPTLVIPLNIALQENRGYLASVSFAIIVGVMIWQAAGVAAGFSLREKLEVRRKTLEVRGYVCIAVAGILIVILSIMTIHRNRVWQDDLTLWSDAVKKSPSSARAHHYMALTYNKMGGIGKAIVEYQEALELEEGAHKAEIHNNLGSLYGGLGLWDLAIYEYKMAIEINPYFYKAHNNLGTVYMMRGELDEAATKFKEALGIYPDYLRARINLGKVDKEKDKLDKK